MSNIAIKVENLGKHYRLGEIQRYKALRDTLTNIIFNPLHVAKSLLQKIQPIEHESAGNIFWALKDVSFEVKQGEVIGIIGRNGAGKSTLLKILSRITEPSEGKVTVYGRLGSLLEVGTGFHPELTGRENVYLNGAILGMRQVEITRKFDEIVAFAEIEKFLDTPVKHYSSGMYMRLAFAVAAHMETEILLIDEVLAVGDAQFQKKCMGKMGEVANQGRTVLFVSHNMNAIEQLCQTAIRLENGQIKEFGQDVRTTIKNYLFGQKNEIGSTEWINSGSEFKNRWFKPLRFFISGTDGKKQFAPLSNNSEMWVQIDAEIEEVDTALTVGYAIYTETGDLLYWSYQTDVSEDEWPKLNKGRCTLRSQIPKRFLNEGVYKIELIGGLHFRQWLFEPGVKAPSIHLTIQGGLSNSPMWIAKRPGVLAPVMKWDEIEC